jgi:hypothetical protein
MPSGYESSPDYGGPKPTWWGTLLLFAAIIASVVLLSGAVAKAAQCSVPLDRVKQQMIAESLASYPGNCPCPYNSDRAGRSCGGRSAYSRPGGYAPLCYPTDISNQQALTYCLSHGRGK